MNSTQFLHLQVRAQQIWADLRESERGQAMVEYVGIALIVCLLVGAVAGAMSDQGETIGGTIANKVNEAINNVKEDGGSWF